MRIGAKTLLALTTGLLMLASLGGDAHATQPAGGITITPAALVLRLTKGSDSAAATFMVSNAYAADLNIHFAVEKTEQPGSPDTAHAHMSFAADSILIPASGTANQTLTLHDAEDIAPGSQTATMVISYGSANGQGVGVLPSMRLPLTVIKEDGAITSIGLTNIDSPGLTIMLPSTATVTIRNTGNVVAIPRGTIDVRTPSGRVLAHGVLNEASRAVSPGTDIKLTTKLMQTATAWVPGPYQLHVRYGLGGDAADTSANARFLFIAWWYPLLISLLVIGAWYIVMQRDIWLHPRKKHRTRSGPPKRQLLVGRDTL